MRAHKGNMKQLNRNAGFSLVELLVVIGIMAVLAVASLTTYTVVSRSNVKKATGSISDIISLARERAKTIVADEWNATIETDGEEIEVKLVKAVKDENTGTYTETVLDEQTLPKNVDIKIIDAAGTEKELAVEGGCKKLSIVFEPLTGVVKSVYYDGNRDNKMNTQTGKLQIVAYYRDKKSSTVNVYFVTGKHIVD